MTKQILSNTFEPFSLAGQMSRWFANKAGQIDPESFAPQIDKFVILNEEAISNSISPRKLKKYHLYLCSKCFTNFLYRKLSARIKDEKLLYDFEKKFLI